MKRLSAASPLLCATIVIALALGVPSARAAASNCSDAAAGSNLYTFNGCPNYALCDATFCACVFASSSNASTCLATSSAGCTTVQECLVAYTGCLEGLTSLRNSSLSPTCAAIGMNIHTARLNVATSGYAGSNLQNACRHRICQVVNSTALTCDLGVNESSVCMATTAAPSSTPAPSTATPTPTSTFPPPATPSNWVAVLRATIRISGTQWRRILFESLTVRNQAEEAFEIDMALYLDIQPANVAVTNMTEGSLVVRFEIANTNKAVSELFAKVNAAATSSTWLQRTKATYATVSTETIQVLQVSVESTAAPATTTPAPVSVDGSGASSCWVLFVAAATLVILSL
jgi:hypothetical protein